VSDNPAAGDILVTTRDGFHYISIVPCPPHFVCRSLHQAREMVQNWIHMQAHAEVSVWHEIAGVSNALVVVERPQDRVH
jgi:hypothetical protein